MSKTNWKDFAELVGIAAIVASLGAVAYQLQQTQAALNASTYQARAFDAIAEAQYVAESEYLLPILVNTQNGQDAEAIAALSDSDHARLYQYFRARMIDWDNEFYQYQNGYLDKDFFENTTKSNVKRMAPQWRAAGMTEPRKEFKEFVDNLLKEESSNSE